MKRTTKHTTPAHRRATALHITRHTPSKPKGLPIWVRVLIIAVIVYLSGAIVIDFREPGIESPTGPRVAVTVEFRNISLFPTAAPLIK